MNTLSKTRFRPAFECLEDRTVPDAAGWLPAALPDDTLRNLVQVRTADHVLDRGDMIALFQEAGRDGVVRAAELASLQAVVVHADELGMPDPVRVLADKVVNGDPANRFYRRHEVGDLEADAPAKDLRRLVDKWFMGKDRPLADNSAGKVFKYRRARGKLFVNDIAHTDVRQGAINDCYFLAALAGAAMRDPESIRDMFIDNGDQTWTVRFYRDGEPDYVTVDRHLPVNGRGKLVFASKGARAAGKNVELWVALAEKAYVQLSESGWVRGPTPMGRASYDFISYGRIADAFEQVTGQASTFGVSWNEPEMVIDAFAAGQLVGFSSRWSPEVSEVMPGHAYIMTGYDAESGTFQLYHGISHRRYTQQVSLTWDELVSSFVFCDVSATALTAA